MTLGFEERIYTTPPELVEIDEVKPHPQNPRKHRIEMIARALVEFGQRSPIIVQESTKYILKGNGTWQAAKHLGWTNVSVAWSPLEGDAAIAYMLADNRPSDLASYDRKKLRDGLAQMIAGPGLNITLWDEDEFEDLDEELRGVSTLPAKGTTEEASGAEVPGGEAKAADPKRKMREVPFVFTAAEHAMFMEWMSQLKSAFGTNDWKETVYEAVRRQAVAEGGGHQQTGKIAPPQVEGQVGLVETIEEQGGAVFSDDLGQPPEPETVYASPGEPVAYRTQPDPDKDAGVHEFERKAQAAAAAAAERQEPVEPAQADWPF